MRRNLYRVLGACVVWGLACGSDRSNEATIGGLVGTGGAAGAGAGGAPSNELPVFGGDGQLEFPDAGASCAEAVCTDGELSASRCGNGELDEGEQCDDGNRQLSDGCNGACNLEPNFDCSNLGQACTSTIVCGDGVGGGGEACDDGNAVDGDGCSAACAVEQGFGCRFEADGASVCVPDATVECGDGATGAGEQCDDENVVAGDGCSASCQVETGFVCRQAGAPCELVQFCGDGLLLQGVEACDDGNGAPGDGCTGRCDLELNFVCPTPGEPCRSTCGDSQVTGTESCDDGNTTAGDGCSSVCGVERGFNCSGGGVSEASECEPAVEEICGDGKLSSAERCDDGDAEPGDGCSTGCEVELGFNCPVIGEPCVRVARCGDGRVNPELGETCDDGESEDGPVGDDGCSATCLHEALFTCPLAGGPCTSDVRCGDGVVNGGETCDDRNTLSGDGCSNGCELEPGFVCPQGGVCRAVCGDGIRAGREQCDDGDTGGGDGCGADCRLEPGFRCDDPAGPAGAAELDICRLTTCGQLGREGTEQCDDGNTTPYDGCDAFCRNEPTCGDDGEGYTCAAVCGDGMKFPEEQCDDGNTSDGDGCSSGCVFEPGFDCVNAAAELESPLNLPIIYRDFRDTHPHFEIDPQNSGLLSGMVLPDLGSSGKPVYNPNFSFNGRPWTLDGAKPQASGGATLLDAAAINARFAEWYTDVPAENVTSIDVLPLTEISAGIFQFSATGANQFFPLTGLGFGNQGRASNFHFTSELRQWFEYQGGELLQFSGDDDVWVFVNGQLTVDLGGIHGELFGSIELLGEGGGESVLCIGTNCQALPVDMNPGGVNEIAVFQAERHVTQSNYTLTLRGFNAPITSCVSVCGDGVVTADEACDLGPGNTGEYETCNPDCTLTPRCGDGEVEPGPEACDNGVNLSTRRVVATDCAPGCVLPPSCGDGAIDGEFEDCDLGAANQSLVNGQVPYGAACGTNCEVGPRCGDGDLQVPAEQCDTGANNGSAGSPCLANCRLRCGNGVVEPGEQCDDGLAANTGGYGACEADCTLGPRCGDAIIHRTQNETCDDGLNNGDYGTCAPGCVVGPFCGDSVVQAAFGEQCDDGAANVTSGYARALCTKQCRPAPFCGDQTVDVNLGETCDDGRNDGSPGSCGRDCRSAIPLASCGDGAVNAGEECDAGARNGVVGSSCDVRCRFACGNGFVDVGEQCDDGVNDGSYGACNPTCGFAAFCGDGAVSPPEVCDNGVANVAVEGAYGNGVCTAACARAPRCGDGRVDSGEECDGSPSCSSSCNVIQ